MRRGTVVEATAQVGSEPMSFQPEATRLPMQWSCWNSRLKSPAMRDGTLPDASASTSRFAYQSAGSKYRKVGAISRAIQIVQPTRVATSVIPHHRHCTRVAGDIERGDATAADDDRQERRAVNIRSRQEDLAVCPPNDPEHGAAGEHARFLDEGHVPREVGHIGPTCFERGHVDRQHNRAGAGAGGLTDEDLTTVASLGTTSRAVKQDPSRGPSAARGNSGPPRPKLTNHGGIGKRWAHTKAVPAQG